MKRKLIMTIQQKNFAAKNHNLVYTYLFTRKLDVDMYYDIVVPGYLRAVVKYDERKELQAYRFATIAWRAMNTDLSNHYRYLTRQKRKAEVLSLDANLSSENGFSLLDTLASNANLEQSMEDKLFWMEVYSLLSDNQVKLIQMRLTGYSKWDISKKLKIPFYEIDKALLNVWSCVRGLFGDKVINENEKNNNVSDSIPFEYSV